MFSQKFAGPQRYISVAAFSFCILAICFFAAHDANSAIQNLSGLHHAAIGANEPASNLGTRQYERLLSLNASSTEPKLPFVSVLVVVTSAASWVDRRDRIRQQFPRNTRLIADPSQSTILKFVIGTQGVNSDDLSAARQEQMEHSDVLLFDCLDLDTDLTDANHWSLDASPSATTSKVLLSVEWAVRHFKFEYYFRLGDDSYLRIDKFLLLLSSRAIPALNAVVGRIQSTELFGMTQMYPSGAGYALTYDVCAFIASNTGVLLKTAPEDCVVARWLFAIGANFVNVPLWRELGIPESCDHEMILVHRLPAELWNTIATDGTVDC